MIIGIRVIMHEVNPQTVQAAQEHAKKSIKHGKSVEAVGKKLQSNDQFNQEISQSIEASGKNIQKNAQKSLEKVHELAENPSTDVLSKSVETHVEASRSFIEASQSYVQAAKKKLSPRIAD